MQPLRSAPATRSRVLRRYTVGRTLPPAIIAASCIGGSIVTSVLVALTQASLNHPHQKSSHETSQCGRPVGGPIASSKCCRELSAVPSVHVATAVALIGKRHRSTALALPVPKLRAEHLIRLRVDASPGACRAPVRL